MDTDAELLRALHDAHAADLTAYTLRLVGGDHGRAQDVVQETLLRAWRSPDLLRSTGEVRGWLFTVARNIVVDQWRSRSRRPEEPWARPPDQPDADRTDHALQAMLVAEALRRLSADHRAVLLECYYRGSTTAQAAGRLGIPAGTVKSRLHYALAALRLALEELGVMR